MNNATEKTRTLVDCWIGSKKRCESAKRELSSAETELANVTNELGRWLVPEEHTGPEPFNIWFGSGVLSASYRKDRMEYIVTWLREPDGKDRQYGI
jgi:hypothetical protein